MNAPTAVGVACEHLRDGQYRDVLRHAIRSSLRRCLCTMFIVDLKARCTTNCVSEVIDDLEEAQWRGVDVRVLIGGSRSTFAIAEAAGVAVEQLTARGLPCKWITSVKDVRGSHAKIVVADESVLLGSHNWSPGAFFQQTQDSVRLVSPALAEYFAGEFERRWVGLA